MSETALPLANPNADPSVRPQDDLFGAVNGTWLKTFVIPPDRSSDGAFRAVHDEAERQVRVIVEECAEAVARGEAEGDAAKVGALYASFMDTARINALGASPLLPDLELVLAPATHTELARALGHLERMGTGGWLAQFVDADPADTTRYALNLEQAGLSLPDEAYYREDQYAQVRDQYQAHLAHLVDLVVADLGEAAPTLPADTAGRAWRFQQALASHHWNAVDTRDEDKTYNPSTWEAFTQAAPGFDWEAWLEALGAPRAAFANLVVREPDFVAAAAALWAATPLEDLKAWLVVRVIEGHAALLSDPIVEADFDFQGRVLTGAQELRERWKRGVSLVEAVLGEAVGRVYVERHFPPAHRAEVAELVDNLIEAYRQSIEHLEWMGPETRAKALEKLDLFTPKIGYPDRWRDYGRLVVDGDLVANVRRAAAFETDYELTKATGPVDRDEWEMTPQTVNAYYRPSLNEIVFPAAILQPPFFTAGGDPAANYGGIGAVIGHEIGHGFDDQGSKFDGQGRKKDWWTAADRAEFERRTSALIAQYDAYVPRDLAGEPDAPHVNGALTIGENIGDLGGLSIAWLAYQLAGHEPTADAARRFFTGWAEVWRSKYRPETQRMYLTVDPHSPAEFRCNGVARNMDVFYDAYGVVEGDGLYLKPEARVTIW
jgi:putative endopeptidase